MLNEPTGKAISHGSPVEIAKGDAPCFEPLEERLLLSALPYLIVDTGQTTFYNNTTEITAPADGDAFYGQDAQFTGNAPSYTLSGDGLTVYDNVTALTWTQSADWDDDGDIDASDKFSFTEFLSYADTLNTQVYGGFSDWRAPTIKELYSLMDFTGLDPSGYNGTDTSALTPFIDDTVFAVGFGDTDAGERIIDGQYWSSTEYLGTTMGGNATTFGLNLVDGRIKGYPQVNKDEYAYFVRGNTDYGVNDFGDNGDSTVTDAASGLMWSQDDSGAGMNWEAALAWVQQKNDENYLGHNDWRLPDAKELQSIVDYSRSPQQTSSAAIDPVFNITSITVEDGGTDWPFFWSGTTHANYQGGGRSGAYVCFGEALGYWQNQWQDVHGAGAQRSDPKYDDGTDYSSGHGPQGDAVRIDNFVRLVRDAEATVATEPYEGYNLFSLLGTTTAYFMDNNGNYVHSWDTDYTPGNSMYFLENGQLLYTGGVHNTTFRADGAGGIIQLIDWDGTVTWEYEYSSTTHLQHHDVEMLPNGNVLMIAWQMKTEAEALAAGRDPSLLDAGELWPGSIIEVQPTGPTTGDIVWEWHGWDHLVQDYDPTKANYGVVADHPELIDLNYAPINEADWFHSNAVDYNAGLDQIVLSIHSFSEFWVIDHSTTTAEAAGHTGGNSGKGGDLLYRWGNPQTYGAGTAADTQLFHQHDVEWIGAGLPGEGNILAFNNGLGRPGDDYTSIVEIVTPVNPDGSYTLAAGSAYGPAAPVWTYTADPPTDFYASYISGAQRLPNGNTLTCVGADSYLFEVTASGETVWEYQVVEPDPDRNAVFRVERYAPSYAGFDGTPLDDEGAFETVQYDFGTASSPVETGYTGVTESTTYSAGAGYGWQSAASGSVNRSSGSDLERDFVYTTSSSTFLIDVPDGTYTISITLGDMNYDRPSMRVYLEGVLVDTVSTTAGSSVTNSYDVTVADGQLTFTLEKVDPVYSPTLNGLTIAETAPSISVSVDPDAFGEGDGSAAAATGTVTRTGDTTGDLVVTLSSDDTSEATVPTSVTIPDGQASVTFDVGAVDDALEDGTQAVTITAAATGYDPATANVSVQDDDAVFAGLQVDFGTSSSAVAAGYTRATDTTLYNAGTGYGWQSAASGSVNRTIGGDLERDFVYTTSSSTFLIDVPDGTYTISITLGDMNYDRPSMRVYLEGVLVDTVSTTAGSSVTNNYDVTVADGQLTFTLEKVDPTYSPTLNALTVF
jgi:uncharacterized protein DUF1566/arylsulfotransferase ASST/beta-agarase/YXIM esterase-like protein